MVVLLRWWWRWCGLAVMRGGGQPNLIVLAICRKVAAA